MNRINQCMAQLREINRKAFVAYIVSGDPRPSVTLASMHELVRQGVDIIELGIPFSDPMAEGPTIQLGHERALEHDVSLTSTLALVKQFRQTNTQTPIVLMGYANPIERMGYEAFTKYGVEVGIDGVLTVDLPPEESANFNEYLQAANLENIFLLAPTTHLPRIRQIVSLAGGFVYYVSLKGVTGAGHLDVDSMKSDSVKSKLTDIRQCTDLPVCVGFGIKDAESARAVAQYADGVVVGSVFVSKMGELIASKDEVIVNAIGQFAATIRQALDKPFS